MESDFQRMQREATQRLLEMNRQNSGVKREQPPKEDAPAPTKKKAPSGDLFSSLFSTGSDGILIAGLLYLLYREKSDNLLMLALLYILL